MFAEFLTVRRGVVLACVFGVVIAAGCMAGVTYADSARVYDEARATMGADGRLYGVPHSNKIDEFVMPDMVRVRATNGVYGYIDHYAQAFAVLGYPETQEEMAAALEANSEKKAAALKEAYAEYYGVDLLSYNDAREAGELLTQGGGQELARAHMTERTCDSLLASMRNGELSADKAAELITPALERGEIRATTISSMSAVENNSAMNAKAFIADGGAWNIDASAVSMNNDAFMEIYERAQEKTAVMVLVYADDGKTVVGEYPINLM